ncbi:hypothetical protein BU23DRAFT_173853 [Bimuria novae-zelandiae CBS 107.79]|uniref:CRIB domain-containing protein n=1 Tax=Bimuria novae-zelandiae CBS 107.79 TaxID=1447943 RepID=A0A6A5V4Q4_9PLEO|nr:hypothetical protein BU23DRAFT_173853 [Bimuria novae-zelandiae CBS 107.79]
MALFAFNRTNMITSSNQSFVDSLATTPSTTTSMSDVDYSQASETSSYGDLASPSGRRRSVFTLRSRSNTVTSTTSTHASPTSTSMVGHEASSSRSLLKNKKGKRLSGSLAHLSYAHNHDESHMGTKKTSMLRKTKKPGEQLETSTQHLKNRISSPFDFQHLTHTNRHHFAALQEASQKELVAGFRAVRASQTPRRDLTGIKAEDLRSSNCSADDVTTTARRSTSAIELRPSPDFVDHVVDRKSTRLSLRQTRSVESFSQPGVNTRMHRHTQSANPPHRVSSRLQGAASPDMATTSGNRQSGVWDNVAPLSPTHMSGLLPSMAEEPDYVGHALTTPDNSAIHPMSPAFSPGLEDVAEEPERFVSPRPAPIPPNRSSKSPRSPSYAPFTFSRRSPTSKSHARKDSHALPKPLNTHNAMRPLSQMSETLPSPGLTRRHSIRKPLAARRKSNTWRVIEESWEDDIDYIYENALEAECELDWESPSAEEKQDNRDWMIERQNHQQVSALARSSSAVSSPVIDEESAASPSFFNANFHSSLLLPIASNVPELEPRSAISSSTTDTQVHTPSDYFNHHGFPHAALTEANRFSFAPSLIGSQDYKEQVHREEMYDNLLADYEGLDKHFPLLEPTRSVPSSTRSSHVRTSKRSSYDSSLISSGHGSGSWTAGIRRSGDSVGSLPELVYSSRNTRQDFSTVVDKLAEQVDSITTHDENDSEDDGATPPGHASQERTFFVSDDEQDPIDSAKATLNAEMKTSLELARQGSTGSSSRTRISYKYTSSEGAARLLASDRTSTDARSRAGSVPQKSRDQYLSLFPSPPKRSPTSMPIAPLSPSAN